MQGFNMGRYVPPDQEGLVSSGNKLLGVRPNKATASGVPIVRFEMPFGVWCDGCEAATSSSSSSTTTTRHPVLVPQGVRFNAEKHRAGAYYSTPIWLFRMRHPSCGTWLEIRTDPATTSYLVVRGGRRRRDYADDDDADLSPNARAAASAAAQAGLDGVDQQDPEAARSSAFERLERTIAHRAATVSALSTAHDRIHGLSADSARRWQDPYARNRALRDHFRAGRHAREHTALADDDLRARLGGLDPERLPHLLPATEEDARRAALIDFGRRGGQTVDDEALTRPLFAKEAQGAGQSEQSELKQSKQSRQSKRSTLRETKAAVTRAAVRDHLTAAIAHTTLRTADPFLKDGSPWGGSRTGSGVARLPGVKRKRNVEDGPGPPKPVGPQKADSTDNSGSNSSSEMGEHKTDETQHKGTTPKSTTLVSYDSD